ncbi:extracellular solute-binding protein [Ramlibacter sp. AW1]|uniref:Extracellular solute-binding protein n=1 Tax=Ramlibacter aurantiacus TaxID=2801330 RepID=A0A936ZM73_9BURK|nr:extracellular solute-binding protein [Ramlibacter aurantiacus]MBL0419853.1 extracellular solute-binding protein [Ramlibacter aurantiacus]
MRRHRLASAIAATGFALLAGAAAAQALGTQELPPEVVKAAQAEGQVMIYSSEDESQQRFTLAAFEKKYGIKGSFIRFPTGPLMQRFNTEHDGGKPQADVVSVSSPIPFRMHADRFSQLTPQGVPNLAQWPKDAVQGNFLNHTMDIVALVYNTEQLKPAEVPRTWSDLADPKWKGKFLLTDPQVADNYMGWLDAVERAHGMDLLRKIATQQYKVTPSGASGVQQVAAGAYVFNAPTFTAFSKQLIEKKAPIAIQYLSNPTVISPRSMAIAAKAPHPNAARLFVNWMLSEEGVRTYCSHARTSVIGDPAGSRGCVAFRDGENMRFDVPEERRRAMAKALGVAN